jgi:tRNA (guanine10-N2)-dimethyltransferase
MRRTYAFELSGEHDTLPRSEALALLEVYSSGFRELCCLDQCLIVKADDLDAQTLGSRLAMTHRIIEVLTICDARPELLADAAKGIRISGNSYRIRARTVKHAPLQSDQVEREVGRALYRLGYKADLRNPDTELRAIITGNKVVLGIEVSRANRGEFEDRRPHLKAFFYPGVLMPRMGRALVNISQAMEGELLIDPFSGTGGILVEACLVGIRGIGVDVQKKLVRGAKVNLEGLNCSLLVGDAKRLPFREGSIDNAVLDTPYGRSALIRAESREELLDAGLAELYRVLKPGRRMIIVADRQIEDHITGANFAVIEIHTDRVHRSLTRHIFVCIKSS